MQTYAIDPAKTRDISNLLLDGNARLRVVPARILEETTVDERLLFGVRQGLYSFPTDELCAFLAARIAGRSAIEVGAGHGVLAAALGIAATDNRQQEEPAIRAYYDFLGQPVVPYGDHVEKLDAAEAVAKHRPQVVIACWVTHIYNPARPEAGGNASGVNEAEIIAACDEYIFVGNEHVHRAKPIWALSHEKITPPWLYSRAGNGSRDFIAIWRRAETA